MLFYLNATSTFDESPQKCGGFFVFPLVFAT